MRRTEGITTVILDCLGTCMPEIFTQQERQDLLRQFPHVDTPEREALMYRILLDHDAEANQQIGMSDPEYEKAFAKYREIVQERVDGIIMSQSNVDVIRNIHNRGYKTAFFSNFSGYCRPSLRKLGLKGFVDATVFSCDTGCHKPQREFYEKGLQIMGCSPEQAIYVDDKLQNVEMSKRVGINSLWFNPSKNPSQPSQGIPEISDLNQILPYLPDRKYAA